MMVPGHGRLVDSADVAYYRDMLTIIRDRVQDLIKKGRTLEQVKAANPSGDYDTEYGSTTGPWTTGMFIEAVYKSLGGGKAPAKAGHDTAAKAPATAARTAMKHACGSACRCVIAGSRAAWRAARRPCDRAALRRRRRPRRRSTSPANGCRSSPTTGAGAW